MSNEPSTIVYRCDFVRQGEHQKTKKERHAIDEMNLPYTLAGLVHDYCYGSECLSKDLADDLFRGTMRDAGIPRRKASFAEWLVEHFAKSHYGKKNDRHGIRFYGKMEIGQ